ncbi:MAG: glycosyltransferase family 9 protein, partial [Armatimonadetes bacterium]|nr:glycosyltransferase family 9 protein [Armatimonadota bacterium]
MTQPQSILVIKTSSLGDIVCALPVLTQLRGLYPAAHIAWVVDHRFADLLAGHPWLDEVYVLEHHRPDRRKGILAGVRGFLGARRSLAKHLRKRSWDVAIDLQCLLKSAFILAASRARTRIAELSGLRHLPMIIAANNFVRVGGGHAIVHYLKVAAPLGVRPDSVRFCLHVSDEARRWADEKLAGMPKPRLVVNPGSAVASKRWPVEHFAEVARRLAATQLAFSIVVTGGGQDRTAAEVITRAAGEACVNLAGQTNLQQLAAVLAASDAMLTGDTGPMHMMAALGKPVVALFGPSNPDLTGPWGDQHVVLRAPDGRVSSISPEQAAQAVERVLSRLGE